MFDQVHDDSEFFYEGDARRCPTHPQVVTSSADGLHDGVCGECEWSSYQAELADELQDAPTWTPDDDVTELVGDKTEDTSDDILF